LGKQRLPKAFEVVHQVLVVRGKPGAAPNNTTILTPARAVPIMDKDWARAWRWGQASNRPTRLLDRAAYPDAAIITAAASQPATPSQGGATSPDSGQACA
jgi:hypothetical protein